MTPRHILLVKTSCHAAMAERERLAGCFFAELFARDPLLWRLFRSRTAMRWPALAEGLSAIVGSIHRLEPIAPVLEWLAWQGAARGVGERHYESVGEALIAALESVLAGEFGPDHREAWGAAYRSAAAVMIAALETQPLAA